MVRKRLNGKKAQRMRRTKATNGKNPILPDAAMGDNGAVEIGSDEDLKRRREAAKQGSSNNKSGGKPANNSNPTNNPSNNNKLTCKMGRPTKYKPEMCERVIELMMEHGYSHAEMARELGIHYTTLLDWAEYNEDFSYALKNGDAMAEAWWMTAGREALRNPKEFNFQVWVANMNNRFGWSHKSQVEETRKEDLTVKFDMSGMSDEELKKAGEASPKELKKRLKVVNGRG